MVDANKSDLLKKIGTSVNRLYGNVQYVPNEVSLTVNGQCSAKVGKIWGQMSQQP